LKLDAGNSPDAALRDIAGARARLLAEFPRYPTREWERQRLSRLLVAGWAVSSLALLALWVVARRRKHDPVAAS
jgi:hypothetical protein